MAVTDSPPRRGLTATSKDYLVLEEFRLDMKGGWKLFDQRHINIFDRGLSWPHLEGRICTFDEMLADIYHWFDKDGTWVDQTYQVRGVNQ